VNSEEAAGILQKTSVEIEPNEYVIHKTIKNMVDPCVCSHDNLSWYGCNPAVWLVDYRARVK
jgi:hypothetical protein